MDSHIGERFGRLVIVGTTWNSKRRRTHMVCKCDCGNIVERQYSHLANGKVKSCGCLLKETTEKRIEEGMAREQERRKKSEQYFLNQRAVQYIKRIKTEYKQSQKQKYNELRKNNMHLYYVWQSMLQRCSNPNHKKYKDYGKRGVGVCTEWQTFDRFYLWAVNNGYCKGLTLDRINTNGNYEPSNCRWTDFKMQANNKRTNKWLEKDGETHTMSEWAERLNIGYDWLRDHWQDNGLTLTHYDNVME